MTHKTRKERAQELLRTVETGPAIFEHNGLTDAQNAELQRRYNLWANSWIVKPLKRLVPELREAPIEELPKITETRQTRSCTIYTARFEKSNRVYIVTTYPDSELMFVENNDDRRRVAKTTKHYKAIAAALKEYVK